ncbi:outer membrane lipoprotein-sorting protein [Fuchsiella alkaliacetigena]|uniref:outer membrane lipoprotein-sorting protein n=1 Tax=Fuchsiella alkaliacetigena TaxID=957042 RepID=UPI00200B3A6E|nr:outer membrane lipoprotein-sorting protein [Fuchsiella alkaliacetigena]MCK8825387.1 outer membrane lipoprotein-sorting protein [Fuchsiella alkaliacetigena]
MKKYFVLLLVGLLVLSLSGLATAQELTGNDVLENVEESISADTAQITFSMELHDGDRVRNRKLETYTMDGPDYDKGKVRFLEPASVEGTGFLTRDPHDSDDDDMYLYMPAVGSVRRIAGSDKNNSFVGTDFSYNDLSLLGGANYDDDYDATIIEENDEEYLLEIIPTDEEIEYSYGKMWVQKSNWFPTKVEFYDEDEELYKVLENEDIKEIDGYWTAGQMTMSDVQDDTKTVLYLEEIIYDEQLDPRLFTTRNLQRY